MDHHPAARPSDACYATALRKASRRLSQLYDSALGQCGLRSTQFAILAALNARAEEPPSMLELAADLVIDRSALGHNLKPLERDGLIALLEARNDRRRRQIVLTAKGKAKLREARTHWRDAQQRIESVFGETEIAGLRGQLLSIANDERLSSLGD